MCWKKAGFLHICHSYGCVCGNRKNGIYVKKPEESKKSTIYRINLCSEWPVGSWEQEFFLCRSLGALVLPESWVIGSRFSILEAPAK